ncbi:uncharacterized protein LOC18438482 isoform X2 [Amborella trichopoda]|uniref:uncharacterized protein LOC18438482 isoform X2 n=1 Tax=Amborella trichopoda TaxID=13333 RepID=UPI0009BF0C5C|nr:uncharacterized protein LOC18438482 isoform X2 [Amborella trichopoda]|eukprot:XP_020525681.1 uncharacterized protein LOC18438482 isoform X2 [Amborella trichopoda]
MALQFTAGHLKLKCLPILVTNRRFNSLEKQHKRSGYTVSERREGDGRPIPQRFPSKALIARTAIAVFALGFIDAGYSGDWSRIGAISKETEELLKVAAYLRRKNRIKGKENGSNVTI